MKKIIYFIGILAIIAIAGLLIFKFAVPNDKKREILQDVGLDDNPIVNEISKAAFIDYEVIDSRPNLMNTKWVVKIIMYNTNDNIVIRKVKIKYYFEGGNETRTYSVDLRPGRVLPAYVNDKISGHSGEELLRLDIIDAE